MQSFDPRRLLWCRTLEGLLGWLQAPKDARWLLVGVPPLRLPSGTSRAVQSEARLTREQLLGCPAFDAALVVVGEQCDEAMETLDTARSWLMPSAPLAVVLSAGSEAHRGLCSKRLREAHNLPLRQATTLRALRKVVLTREPDNARDR
ncbi:MAG: hypothetical protein RMJ98_09845 [Myxococcales bacterium]|nr:hypothetical protein [Polyangiaceae bacterium]MDW8249591.1 hypothetical protein [Myxococcales bacterium]